MATRTLNWCTSCKLECHPFIPTQGYACVPAALLNPEPETFYGFVDVNIRAVRKSGSGDVCCGWVYTLDYDDTQLATGRQLTQQNINSVMCSNCLTDFILSKSPAINCPQVNACVECDTVNDCIDCAVVNDCVECDTVRDCVCYEATNSITPNTTLAGCTSFDANISADPGNQVSIQGDGFFVPEGAGVSVLDTDSIDLTLSGAQISAEVLTTYDDWVPVFTAAGGMTVAATILTARHFRLGSTRFFTLAAELDLGGVASNQVFFTLPDAESAVYHNIANPARFVDSSCNGVAGFSWSIYSLDNSLIGVRYPCSSDFTLGTGQILGINGFYEIA